MPITVGKQSIGNIVQNFNYNSKIVKNKVQDYSGLGNVKFPFDLMTSAEGFFLQLNFFQYSRPNVTSAPASIPIGTIQLPIPSIQNVDHQSLNYTTQETGMIAGALLNGLDGQIQNWGNAQAMLDAAESAIAAGGIGAVSDVVKNFLKQFGVGGNNAASLGGVAMNPYLTVLFRNANFKRFSFSWLFVPENHQDSVNLNFIINKLRYHSLPDLVGGDGGPLLGYPDMCKPVLMPQGYQHDFKYCVITDLVVDYVPGDTPAFQATDQAPAAIKLTINLMEIELWHKEDLYASTYES